MGIFSKFVLECDAGYEKMWLRKIGDILEDMEKSGEKHYFACGTIDGHWRKIEIELDY